MAMGTTNVVAGIPCVQSGYNVYVQATSVQDANTACRQGAYHVPSQAAQGGNVYGTEAVPVTNDMAATTGGSSMAPAAVLGKDLLQDRARNLRAVPKSQGSKSKRQQFLETHGYKRPRGGQCREYFGQVYHRDP